MAQSNVERIGRALELLNQGLKPFVERELRAAYGENWIARAELLDVHAPAAKKDKAPRFDTHALLAAMWDQWNDVFKKTLGQAERSLVSELRETRNKWAHQEPFTTDDAYRALDSMGRLLSAVSAPEAQEVEKQKQEVLRARFEEQARRETRRATTAPIEGKPASGLKPWREIATPHPDVASGRYQQAEFAADLWQVYMKEGSDEYRNPTEFYRRTFLTDGLSHLLRGGLERIVGKGGDPVVELQTNFGGGKTHALLALYHLLSGTPLAQLPGIEPIVRNAGVSQIPKVNRAVLVGTKISPGQPVKKSDGTLARTLWGELAWQLDGKEGYKLVKEADETGTNPGDALRELFNRYAPCLILIDEWVAYARQLHAESDLPGGSFGTHFTFAQTLSEAAKAADRALLVVSIPVSDYEIGGEKGKEALDSLKNAIGRVHSPWRPASAEESFEIVRRRLFQTITDPQLFAVRDAVVRAFAELYYNQKQEFPNGCNEADYERRLREAYPIHPELFDRLYTDWSSLDRFQRTRGVLRLMAAVIHALWERQDSNLLILPATVPIDEPLVQNELTRYLDDPWIPVIEKDIDGPNSLPLRLDRENPNLGRYSACRRVARTLFLGSAATLHTAHKGLEDRQIKLGCVQPGESVATFGDALRRLNDGATHLYIDGSRYWYSTQPSVARLAQDRAAQQDADKVLEEIKRLLREEQRTRGDFARVHACPGSSGDVSDDPEARLVILGPEFPHAAKSTDSVALLEAVNILDQRGATPRNCKNAFVILAADRNRLTDLQQAVRDFLAWKSIEDEWEQLNLDAFQTKLAQTKRQQAEETVEQRIPETYIWLLVPAQPDPQAAIKWDEIRLQGQDALAVRASKKLKNEELLLTQLAGTRLRLELDRIPLWRGDHVGLKQLADDFSKYVYLPRLKDSDVLVDAVRDGVKLMTWCQESFAYADAWDAEKGRYRGLRAGQLGTVTIDGQSVLVKSDVAAKQLEVEAAKQPQPTPPSPGTGVAGTTPTSGGAPSPGVGAGVVLVPAPRPTRFHGSVDLDPARIARDAGKIAEEVVQHISGLVGGKVSVSLEINAEVPEGVPENVVRTVTENCQTLKFKTHGFEEK